MFVMCDCAGAVTGVNLLVSAFVFKLIFASWCDGA